MIKNPTIEDFVVFEPEKKMVGRKEHIIFAYQTYFNHITIIGKRGKRTQVFIPFGKNVPPSLRGKRYKSPFNYKKDKERFDGYRMTKIRDWRAVNL